MIAPPPALPVPLQADESGVIRIGETRVTLDSIVYAFRRGTTPEAIVEKYPTLTLLDVYLVTAYYLQYREEVDAYLRHQEALAEAVRQRVEQDYPVDGLRERLMAKLEAKRRT
ncbi:MAG: DUF433 domain-containing protein [Anaerolineae bacterium]|nr:DUF433 domain-containing protein [Anaerolineae bacterium]